MGQAVKRMIACNINESKTLRDLLFRLWIAADSLSRMSKRRVLLATLAVLLGGCASGNRAVPRPFPEVSRPAARGEEASTLPIPHDSPGWQVVETALTFRGTPYRRGGTDPRGFDCSGFVHYVFGAHGLPLPRNVSNLYRRGERVHQGALAAGDLVFFSTVAAGASHVGIALGDGTFVHAPSSGGHVRVENLGSSYWGRRYVGARRFTAGS